MIRKILRQYYGILLGVLVLLLHYLLNLFPYTWIDKIYTSGLYPIFKWILLPFQWLPFPSLYLFIGILLLYIALGGLLNREQSFFFILKNAFVHMLNIIGLLVCLFYIAWAFNYRSLNVQERLQLSDVEVDAEEFHELYEDITLELLISREELMLDNEEGILIGAEMNHQIDSLQRDWLRQLGYPVMIPAMVKPLFPGSLLRISTAGFYFPFGGEGYYDGGLHPLTVPFVIAHELAHNYGVTDEGEANFVAFHTCMRSDDPLIRYSALLDLWRYLAATYRRMDPDRFEVIKENIPEPVWEDLRSIREQHAKYPDILPKIRDQIYNMYLQSQGVEEGMASYARIIELELAYRKKYPSRR